MNLKVRPRLIARHSCFRDWLLFDIPTAAAWPISPTSNKHNIYMYIKISPKCLSSLATGRKKGGGGALLVRKFPSVSKVDVNHPRTITKM